MPTRPSRSSSSRPIRQGFVRFGRRTSAVSTRSGAAAAPVLVCQERCSLRALRAIVANSGCANAATGAAGIDAAVQTQEAAARALGIGPEQVAVASTGGISHALPVELVLEG